MLSSIEMSIQERVVDFYSQKFFKFATVSMISFSNTVHEKSFCA